MGFIFGLPPDVEGCSGVLVLVDRLTKMVQLIPVNDTVTAVDSAVHFIDCIFRHHGLSESIRPRPAVHVRVLVQPLPAYGYEAADADGSSSRDGRPDGASPSELCDILREFDHLHASS
ncbi:hypothetical protein PR003_g17198 [Phytophthora rubi]|uniref:Integrase catalytic domain-containing protein n=1 Tax=Phytophthora rubi TaxID=129364 RepID=A0A6A4ESM8_9STRA|nr:hypothetical protein PR003_g17198 [Phytophthora rubi]